MDDRVRAISIFKELSNDDTYRHYWLVQVFEAWPDVLGVWRWMDKIPIAWPREKGNGRRLPPDTGQHPALQTIKYARGKAKALHLPYIPNLHIGSVEGLSDVEMLARMLR
jgi:hypothetical protein